jgi:type 2 lantibiotic biosynthesis protein LanM
MQQEGTGPALVPDWLERVALRARTLRERLEAGDVEWTPRARAEWLRSVGADGPEADEGSVWLDRRIAWSAGSPAAQAGLPEQDWPAVAAEIWVTTRAAAVSGSEPRAVTDDPTSDAGPAGAVPFSELVSPVVEVGLRRLHARLGHPLDVEPSAVADLERDLSDRVLHVAGRVLDAELATTRGPGQALLLFLGQAADPPGTAVYRAWVAEQAAAGWRPLFERYPVLARLLGITVLHWVDAVGELLERLVADRASLAELGVPLQARVVSVEGGISDWHHRGRTAMVVRFDGGTAVVYKPKPLRAEALLTDTINVLNAHGLTPRMKGVPVVVRDGYGWASYLEPRPCQTPVEVSEYYVRAGMLLGLLHILRATDAHYENVIAHGAHPVLVDAETILYPDPVPLVAEPGRTDADPLEPTVMRTGFLPAWQEVDGRAYDGSALTGLDGQQSTVGAWGWVGVGTDDLRLIVLPRGPQTGNVVRFDGRRVAATEHEAEIVTGFRRLYDLVMAQAGTLTTAGGPLHDVATCPVRFVFRPTRVYAGVLAGAVMPERLVDGLTFGLHLDGIARAYASLPERPAAWPLLDAELSALERLDVPLFERSAGGTEVTMEDGRVLDAIFEQRTAVSADTLLASLSVADRERQAHLVSASLRVRGAAPPKEQRRATRPHPPGPGLRPEELLAEAVRIGDLVLDSAVPSGRGGITWFGPGYLETIDRYRLDLLGPGLYDGVAGVAVFLAALGESSGQARFTDGALAALGHTRELTQRLTPGEIARYARWRGLGLGSGLGADVYALTSVGRALGQSGADLLVEATALATAVLRPALRADTATDVLSGSCGAVLALSALHARTGCQQTRELAVAAGDHAVRHRAPGDPRSPGSGDGRALTGFAHGAAGAAYALARLGAQTGEPRFLDAAQAELTYEQSVFDPVAANWPDLRADGVRDPSGFCVKWCHGAAGIAMSRSALIGVLDRPELATEAAAGYEALRGRLLQQADFACCGNAGRIESLLVGSRVGGGEGDRRVAEARAAASAMVRAARSNGYQVCELGERENPGFFLGMAGIGHVLLRVADPRVPSVLLAE